MKLHTQVLLAMGLGAVIGVGLQVLVPADSYTGVRVVERGGQVVVDGLAGPAQKSKLRIGDVLVAVSTDRTDPAASTPVGDAAAFNQAVQRADNGTVLWLRTGRDTDAAVNVELHPTSLRARIIDPFDFVGDLFLALLKMLIVPLVLTSIIVGVAGLRSGDELRRLSLKTFAYYTASSLVAIVVGQLLVNLISPGDGATLGLPPLQADEVAPDASFIGVIKRMIPTNIFSSLGDNGAMLQIIFFALLFGFFITKTKAPHGPRMADFFESALEVMMNLAQWVLTLIPYGVFCLLVKVVGTTGVGIFLPLALFMLTVVLALVVHAAIALPAALFVFTKTSPLAWAKAMGPALLTAFSTSSSSMTLPVTLETVQERGGVSKKVSSFTLPLGATINMDGTALYECIGVIFLAQYYASAGAFDFSFDKQVLVVGMALLASVGAAGIPSAGLVMMLTILSALKLPLEGAALLLAVDRPLDMLRTTVNVWSDSCAAAVIAHSEGETLTPAG